MMTTGSDPLEMRVWITLSVKSGRTVEMMAKSKKNLGYTVEGKDNECHLQTQDQLH